MHQLLVFYVFYVSIKYHVYKDIIEWIRTYKPFSISRNVSTDLFSESHVIFVSEKIPCILIFYVIDVSTKYHEGEQNNRLKNTFPVAVVI